MGKLYNVIAIPLRRNRVRVTRFCLTVNEIVPT